MKMGLDENWFNAATNSVHPPIPTSGTTPVWTTP